MLHFLIIVLQHFSTHSIRDSLSKRRKDKFIMLLNALLNSLAKCIPHHLNEEIFSVCELLIELLLSSKDGLENAQ